MRKKARRLECNQKYTKNHQIVWENTEKHFRIQNKYINIKIVCNMRGKCADAQLVLKKEACLYGIMATREGELKVSLIPQKKMKKLLKIKRNTRQKLK